MRDDSPGLFPVGPCATAMERAAIAQLVILTRRPHAFTDDLGLLAIVEPEVDFAVGQEPSRAGLVYVWVATPGTAHLCTRDDEHGVGLYIRLRRSEGEGGRRELGVDPDFGPCETVDYREYD